MGVPRVTVPAKITLVDAPLDSHFQVFVKRRIAGPKRRLRQAARQQILFFVENGLAIRIGKYLVGLEVARAGQDREKKLPWKPVLGSDLRSHEEVFVAARGEAAGRPF